MSKNCEQCRYSLLEDDGYSNFTVEGTTFLCLKRLHPEKEGFDRWYGGDKRLEFAEQCPGFTEGEGVHVDVDHGERPYNAPEPWWYYYIEDDERRELAKALDVERTTKPFDSAPEREGREGDE